MRLKQRFIPFCSEDSEKCRSHREGRDDEGGRPCYQTSDSEHKFLHDDALQVYSSWYCMWRNNEDCTGHSQRHYPLAGFVPLRLAPL